MSTPVPTPNENDVTVELIGIEVKGEAGALAPGTAVGVTGSEAKVQQAQISETQREWPTHVEIANHPVKPPTDKESGA